MRAIKFLLAMLVSIALVACGGGGGSSTPAATTFSISGTVSGAATSGVTITLSGNSSASTTTGAGGTYTFTGLANGNYTVTPTLAGYSFSPTNTSVTVSGASMTANFTASNVTYSISGTVSPSLSGVLITATAGATTTTATTGASGTYTLTGLANGNYTVTPSKTGYSFSPISTSVSVNNANGSATNFTGTATATTYSISGAVSGAVTSGVMITLSGANTGSVVTGAGGAYAFSGLVAGNYTVTPSLTGYTFSPPSISITALAASSTTNNFTATLIPVAHNVTGNVSPTLASVTITATNTATSAATTATTDASGNYTIGLYDGSYTLAPSKTGYTFAPNSTSVTMSGANVPNKNFAGTANSAVTATVSGTVTGAWKQGVTITMSGGTTGTTTTDVNGNYSFAGVASGASYTFTPTLAGYSYTLGSQSVNITGGSSAPVTVPAMAASSLVTSYSISGTVSYAGTKTGPISIKVYNSGNTCGGGGCSPNGGTLITLTGSAGAYTGNYTIRGLQNFNSYYVVATMDTLGTGITNASDPVVNTSVSPTTISSANATANLTLADPSTPAPVALPTAPQISSGDTGAFVMYGGNGNVPADANGNEIATSYKLYWGTDPAASTGGGNVQFAAQGNNNSFYMLKGLTNGSQLYFKVTALVGSTETSPSTALVSGPVLIGATTGANTVSGTVTFPGTAQGPMMVLLHSGSSNIYFTRVGSQASPPASGASYSISGVAAGSYQAFVVVDNNNNGIVDAGDFTYGNQGNTPTIAVSGTTTSNITLSTGNATVAVMTNYYYCGVSCGGYGLNLVLDGGTLRPVNVTLFSGSNVAVPFDMGFDSNNNWMNVNLSGATPAVGDSYGLLVTFSDGTTQIISGSVTGVLGASNLAQSLAIVTNGTGGSSATVPLFTWAAPATAPSLLPYTYRVNFNGNNNSTNWNYPNDIGLPSTTSPLQVLYNVDGSASPNGPLVSGLGNTYSWQVQVQDANRNSAQMQAPTYTLP